MAMTDFSQDFAVLGKALNLRTQRHQVLASNIANADTPHYKARDFDFQAAMQNAVSGRSISGGLNMSVTARGHLAGSEGVAFSSLQYRGVNQASVDGNTVDMDAERAQMTDNAMQYQILTQLVSDKFRRLKSAVSSTQA